MNLGMAFNGDDDYDPKAFPAFGIILLGISLVLLALLLLIVCVTAKETCVKRRRQSFSRPNSSIELVVDDQDSRLEKTVVESFPVFVYQCKNEEENGLECAVCLSEFEEEEKGRILPACKHRFHVDCIDMWFDSHSTCPLCRTDAQVDTSNLICPVCRSGAQADPPSTGEHVVITLVGETSGSAADQVACEQMV
ncbi:hypothetical protein SUGI_0112320 [Cryptomeria japonica]|uniref:RING-H2 finger protein ATL64 n=1 Tax=Cryptomeria japonica TaxID=3369 RepID=UPI0024089438|nr:RING-H2 finger protein ATL64 [Cryptomeria japonica]GLJ09581.1 hypothetical protein SUGI_0112320 [Cryptomeria japonica]